MGTSHVDLFSIRSLVDFCDLTANQILSLLSVILQLFPLLYHGNAFYSLAAARKSCLKSDGRRA